MNSWPFNKLGWWSPYVGFFPAGNDAIVFRPWGELREQTTWQNAGKRSFLFAEKSAILLLCPERVLVSFLAVSVFVVGTCFCGFNFVNKLDFFSRSNTEYNIWNKQRCSGSLACFLSFVCCFCLFAPLLTFFLSLQCTRQIEFMQMRSLCPCPKIFKCPGVWNGTMVWILTQAFHISQQGNNFKF